MQTCKLRVELNFLFQLCPSFSFSDGLVDVSKNRYCSPNTNQREINERRTGSADFKLFKLRREWNVSLIFTFVTGWCEAKGWGCSCRICCGRRGADMRGTQPSKPSWTPAKLPGTCFLQTQASFFVEQYPFPSPRLVLEGCTLLITMPLSWIIPILRSGRWVPAGHDCRHRWESRPVIASICHCALASVCFLYCFSFCLSSLSLFFPWIYPVGTERWCYRGSKCDTN